MATGSGFGVDFGTTTSSAAKFVNYRGGASVYVPYGEAGRPIPSVVAIDRLTGEIHTGLDAWERRAELMETCECFVSIKTELDKEDFAVPINGTYWHAYEIASEILKSLKEKAKFSSVTLAIPVGLRATARRTLRNAARIAGIEVESFVSEPTAAFFANYDALRGSENVAVFDWGGGTLDVSILRHVKGRITELAKNGLPEAGNHIDELFARRIHGELVREKGVNKLFEEMEPENRDKLVVACERAKCAFSESETAEIAIARYGDFGRVFKVVKRDWFEDIIASLINKAMDCLINTIGQSDVSDKGIDRIVLVGGSSNLRPLRQKMIERFGDRLFYPEDPDWSISEGAAALSRIPGAHVAAQNVGIILSNGSFYPLLKEGEAVNGWHREVEFGITDTTETLRVVFSGSQDIDKANSRLRIIEVPGYRFLEERLILKCEVDENLVFRVTMKSSMRNPRDTVVWEYEELKLAYDIERAG